MGTCIVQTQDSCGMKAEHGKERRRQTSMPEVEEHTSKGSKNEYICRPDQEVKEDERAIPIPRIRPCVEKRERQAPEQPRHHRPKHTAREERHARPVLHEHENHKDRKERREKILCAHVLPHIDVTRGQRQEIRPCRRRIADPFICPLRRYLHILSHYSMIKISRSCLPNISASA